MSDKNTIARPYAVAVFEIAKEANEIDEWGGFLEALQVIISNSDFVKFVENPVFTADLALEVVLESLTSATSKDQENFIKLLLSSGRINVYPEIKGIFDALRKEDSGILTAEVFTPYTLSEKEKKIIETEVRTSFGGDCVLDVSISPDLIGGVFVRVGDAVLDLSIKGRLRAFEQRIL